MSQLKNLNDPKLIETYKILQEANRVLTFKFISQKLIEKGILKNDLSGVERSKYWSSVIFCLEIFTTLESFKQAAIGLKEWVPYRRKPTKKFVIKHTNLFNNEINITAGFRSNEKARGHFFFHKLIQEEIDESFMSISRELLNLYKFTGEGFSLTIYCYGDYTFNVWVNSKYKSLHSSELSKFYIDNKLQVGDTVFLEKREDDPAGLHLYTKWQLDNFKIEEGGNFPVIVEETKTEVKDNQTHENIDPVYILASIQKEDLVYKYLIDNGPSEVLKITIAISKRLGVKVSILDKLSYIDFADLRICRLQDGRIALKEADHVTQDQNVIIRSTPHDNLIKFFAILIIVVIAVMAMSLFL